jgi:hypothetical protein
MCSATSRVCHTHMQCCASLDNMPLCDLDVVDVSLGCVSLDSEVEWCDSIPDSQNRIISFRV